MKIRIPLQVVEIDEGNFHLFAECVFENGTTGYWAIDTGANKTIFNRLLNNYYIIDEESAGKEIQSSGLGEMLYETRIGTLLPFTIGNYRFESLQVALIDLSHINRLYNRETDKKICGLIGGDFLHRYKAVIDYGKKSLLISLVRRKKP